MRDLVVGFECEGKWSGFVGGGHRITGVVFNL